jgi:hypothetical protein
MRDLCQPQVRKAVVTTVTFICDESVSAGTLGLNMMAKLKIVEISKGGSVELPEKIIPVAIEPILENVGLTVPVPSDRFTLYYLERES